MSIFCICMAFIETSKLRLHFWDSGFSYISSAIMYHAGAEKMRFQVHVHGAHLPFGASALAQGP
jgi:hypothetical protein